MFHLSTSIPSATSRLPSFEFHVSFQVYGNILTVVLLLYPWILIGGEVTTVRIMKAPTGVLHGYCSFANEKDALKAVEMWKKMGMSAIPIGSNHTSLGNSSSSSTAQQVDDVSVIKSGSKPTSATLKRWKS